MPLPLRPSYALKTLTLSVFLSFTSTALLAAPTEGTINLLIQPKPGMPDHVAEKIVNQHGGQIINHIKQIDIKIVNVPVQAEKGLTQAIANNANFNFVEKDELQTLNLTPDDPHLDNQWHHNNVESQGAWGLTKGDGIRIAILDTGVDADHPDLIDKLLPGWNSASENNDWTDNNGHGTKVSGTAAATTNNGFGVAGVSWNAQIIPIRVSDQADGSAYTSDIASGLVWAADNGADIANISYGVSASASVTSAANYLRDRGGLVTVSAGNSGSNPGYSENTSVISVSATDANDNLTSWSSHGNYVDVAAPGSRIYTTANGGGFASVAGTSFSSPLTAGIIGLIMSANPSLSIDEVESILEQSADDRGPTGWDTSYGHGRVNARAAVAMASEWEGGADTVLPEVAITNPTGGTVSGLVNVDVNATDNVAIQRVELYVNNQLLATDTSLPYSFSWDSDTVADDLTTLTAVALDSSANQNQATVEVNVQNGSIDDVTPPTINILSPSNDEEISGKRFMISAIASDAGGVREMSCYLDGTLLATALEDSISCNVNTRKIEAGTHTIMVTATDHANNQSDNTVTVTVVKDSGGNKAGGKGGGKRRGPK